MKYVKFAIGLEIIILFIALSGCGMLYGYRSIKTFDETVYNDFISDINDTVLTIIPVVSDFSTFKKYRTICEDSLWQHSYSGQPVQILYFMNDSLVSYHINCMAKGLFSNLNWNTEERFERFPPASAVKLHDFSLNGVLDLYDIHQKDKCVVIVFWTTMFCKISKSAVETVKSNIHKFGKNQDIIVYLINTDKYYLEAR